MIYREENDQRKSTETFVTSAEESLHPYHNFFQILHSLSAYIVEKKKPVHLQHYLELIESPMMGVVEWPMIIGGRDMSELPPVFT